MRKLLVCVAVLMFAGVASAQTHVDIAGIFTKPAAEGSKVGLRGQISLLNEVGPVMIGGQFSDQQGAAQEYGPSAALSLGTWNLNKAGTKTVSSEIYGWTDVTGGVNFDNGVVGVGALFDLVPDNRITVPVKILWRGAEGESQDILVSLGLRFELEK